MRSRGGVDASLVELMDPADTCVTPHGFFVSHFSLAFAAAVCRRLALKQSDNSCSRAVVQRYGIYAMFACEAIIWTRLAYSHVGQAGFSAPEARCS